MKTIGLKAILLYSIASFGTGVFWAFNNADLPLYLDGFTQNAILIGLLSSTRSFEGSLIQPVIGAWSDVLWTRLGRRRPFILVGIPIAVLFLALVPAFNSLFFVVVGVIAFSFFFNVALDPYSALLGDLFPVHQRSTVNSVATVLNMLGQVTVLTVGGVLWKTGIPAESFYLVAVLLLVSFGITFFGTKEVRKETEERKKVPLSQYLSDLFSNREAFKFLTTQFFFWFAINAVTPFLTLFAVKGIGVNDGEAQTMFLVLVLSTAVAAVPIGLAGDRFGNKRILSIGLVVFVLAGLAGTVVTDPVHLMATLVLAGIGNAATSVLAYPLLTQLVPNDKLGIFTGLNASFASIAIPISVFAAGGLINLFGYRSIFYLLMGALVLAFAVLQTITVTDNDSPTPDLSHKQEEARCN